MGEGKGQPAAIIMAAGKGTRMNSDLPKVCHPVGGRAMVCAVVDACLEAGCGRVVVVVGYKGELVREALAGYGERVEYAVQAEQLGTGHAVMAARGAFGDAVKGEVFVLCGDGPLVRAETLGEMLRVHRAAGAACTIATSELEDPAGYGRIVRDAGGRFAAIVEHKNATEAQRAIREVNPSYYCFDAAALFAALGRVERNALTGEYYLTDVPGLLLGEGRRVELVGGVPGEDVLSINTPGQLAEVDRIFRSRRGAVASASKGGRGAS